MGQQYKIVPAPYEIVPLIWGEIREWVEEGLESSPGDKEPRHIYIDLMERDAQLWLIVVDDPVGIIITEIVKYPKYKVVYVTLSAGSDAKNWIDEADRVIGEWARSNDCAKLRIMSKREGWSRIATGLKKVAVVMEKDYRS